MTVVEVKLPLEIPQWIASKVDRRIGDCEELCAVLWEHSQTLNSLETKTKSEI